MLPPNKICIMHWEKYFSWTCDRERSRPFSGSDNSLREFCLSTQMLIWRSIPTSPLFNCVFGILIRCGRIQASGFRRHILRASILLSDTRSSYAGSKLVVEHGNSRIYRVVVVFKTFSTLKLKIQLVTGGGTSPEESDLFWRETRKHTNKSLITLPFVNHYLAKPTTHKHRHWNISFLPPCSHNYPIIKHTICLKKVDKDDFSEMLWIFCAFLSVGGLV